MIKMNSKNGQKIIQCYHCGNETLMNIIGKHSWEYGTSPEEPFEVFNYTICACPVCGKLTIVENYDFEFGSCTSTDIIFPINRLDSTQVPKKIMKSFDSALKIRNIDYTTSMMAIRKTLEAICIDKDAVGRTLENKIEDLAEKGILPITLKEASTFARQLGNEATHLKIEDVSKSDLDVMIDFITHIIDYLYIIPSKIQRYKERLEFSKKDE